MNSFIKASILILSTSCYAENSLSCGIIRDINTITIRNDMKNNVVKPPSPLEYIHHEGQLPNSKIYIKSTNALKDIKLMHNYALAWKLKLDYPNTLNLAKLYLLSWIKTYKPTFNPIDESSFSRLFDTYGIIKDEFSSTEQNEIEAYLKKWAYGYIYRTQQAVNNKHGMWRSNWQSHRVKIVTFIAYLTNDITLQKQAKIMYINQLNANIDGSGVTYDFKERDAIYYVIATLQPLIDTVLIARRYGEDWYNIKTNAGASLPLALEWVKPYIVGDKKHLDFRKSTVSFDKVRANYGLKDFHGYFNPQKADAFTWKVSNLDNKYIAISKKISKIQSDDVTLCW